MLLTLKEEPHQVAEDFTPADAEAYGPRRWRRVQWLADEFWKSWRRSYIQTLQARRKWLQPRSSLAEGDLVLMVDKLSKRCSWPLARVTAVKQSADGHVRSASVVVARSGSKGEIKKYYYNRPVVELVYLMSDGLASGGRC